jgi:hypothetical protein
LSSPGTGAEEYLWCNLAFSVYPGGFMVPVSCFYKQIFASAHLRFYKLQLAVGICALVIVVATRLNNRSFVLLPFDVVLRGKWFMLC